MKISVIIPCLNEEKNIRTVLEACRPGAHEIIVVDGGSQDQSVAKASGLADLILSSPPGRGRQQALGARHATGDVLLFLHADTLPPAGFEREISRMLQDPAVVFGAFSLGADYSSLAMELICFGANLRTRLFDMPYGDQAIFVRKEAYWRAGGFANIPLMEEVDLVKKLLRIGGFKLSRARVRSSARRWLQDGYLRRTLGNYSLMLRYQFGAKPEDLHGRYKNNR
ncbi:transferase 2, rSAM/selenodomain-associated [Desulfatibacillum alkenivorans DSM 16219]|uniref:Transferase 2, rSAM/selenodomain-associated n=1 Tax=Desulfatibacillum alkenivorans DSM 16219 TaxID=1121393 RepID=A0A1M6R9H5_9BACT|nr:TIGR04283 family arsenosugar biosynthesis glycosyltransferase [Desulfatibacillum alkenivorans]SHK29125.1 transferase 2, rSAM/selenodomain-associated [Desulfatibacillum alkenivorans DSM 16219]